MTHLKWDRAHTARRDGRARREMAAGPTEDELRELVAKYKKEGLLVSSTPALVPSGAPGIVEVTPEGAPEMTTEIVEVAPSVAIRWLEGNIHNRPLRQVDVERMTRAMREGRWELNGESIIFDAQGMLLDGQHRLWACVESGVAFRTVVVRGVHPRAFTTIDQGRRRSLSDHLVVASVTDGVAARTLSTTLVLVHRYRTGTIFTKEKLPPQVIIDLARREPAIKEWLQRVLATGRGLRAFAPYVAATVYLGAERHPVEASAFVRGWVTGAELEAESPILALRTRVAGNPPQTLQERFALAIVAFNAHLAGRALQRVRIQPDRFPKITGV